MVTWGSVRTPCLLQYLETMLSFFTLIVFAGESIVGGRSQIKRRHLVVYMLLFHPYRFVIVPDTSAGCHFRSSVNSCSIWTKLPIQFLVVRPGAPKSFLFLVAMPGAPSSCLLVRQGVPGSFLFLFLVVRPGVPSSFLFLVVRPGAPSSFFFF